MRIAICHFHLRPGGVTRVIEMAAEAMGDQGHDVIVLTGEPAPDSCRLRREMVTVVPELAYGVQAISAPLLNEGVSEAFQKKWGGWPDVFHVHNHSLGKNFALPLAVAGWARERRALVLQLHDFAENGRPENYRKLLSQCAGGDPAALSEFLYPVSPTIRYALLNSRDQQLMAGLTGEGRAVLLANPVILSREGVPVLPSELGAERIIVYPTRAIRRKNLGEFLLWSAFAGPGEKFVVTSSPQSPADALIYGHWKTFAESHGLPVVFEGIDRLRRPVEDFLSGASMCVTSSVAEGFGMAFLEPWMAGTPLAGRDIPGVTRDFKARGVHLAGLYDRLAFPANWLSFTELQDSQRQSILATAKAYAIEPDEEDFSRASRAVLRDGQVDFGRLDESFQTRILARVVKGAAGSGDFAPTKLDGSDRAVAANRVTIDREYNLHAFGLTLMAIYSSLLEETSGDVHFVDAREVLLRFLDWENFFALKS